MELESNDLRQIGFQNLKCEYSLLEALGFVVLWLILSVITLGIGSFFLPYTIFTKRF